MPCQYYPPADLDELEEEAETASPEEQEVGLQIVADIFNNAQLAYALMGGMNFYLRGSGRTTQDVDLAISRAWSLEATLNLLNNDSRIIRPANRMSWMSGVARIFVLVGRQRQPVQLDLKWQRAEGHGMPADLDAATELIRISRDAAPVRCLAIGPLVKAKFQSYGRGFDGDYTDLHFVCTHRRYGRAVRDIAQEIRESKRRALLEEVKDRDPQDEAAVRWALRLDRTPSPEQAGGRSRGAGGSRGSPKSSGGGSLGDGSGNRAGTTRSTPTAGEGLGSGATQGSRTSSSNSRTSSSRTPGSLTSQMQRLHVSSSDSRAAGHRVSISTTASKTPSGGRQR